MDEFRSSGCVLCHEISAACLCAHHVEPEQKEFTIGTMLYNVSDVELRAELAKCVCLCHNCHAKLHAGIISLPQP
jgi:hypothetical protein